jgi:hypothetical protein
LKVAPLTAGVAKVEFPKIELEFVPSKVGLGVVADGPTVANGTNVFSV